MTCDFCSKVVYKEPGYLMIEDKNGFTFYHEECYQIAYDDGLIEELHK